MPEQRPIVVSPEVIRIAGLTGDPRELERVDYSGMVSVISALERALTPGAVLTDEEQAWVAKMPILPGIRFTVTNTDGEVLRTGTFLGLPDKNNWYLRATSDVTGSDTVVQSLSVYNFGLVQTPNGAWMDHQIAVYIDEPSPSDAAVSA